MEGDQSPRKREFAQLAKPMFARWERLRLPYNLFLLTVLLITRIPRMGAEMLNFWALGPWLVGAVLANLCFFLGPLLETYIAWLGYRARWVTVVIFIVGLLVSIPLVTFFPPTTLWYGMD